MTLEEFYKLNESSYAEVFARLKKDELLYKYLNMFKSDDTLSTLNVAVDKNDSRAAFAASHNLKGVCANLGIGNLFKLANEICELLRHDDINDHVIELLSELNKVYQKVIQDINNVTL